MSNSDSCRSLFLVGPYVLNELDDAESATLERHISGCETCRTVLDETREAIRFVDHLTTPGFEQLDGSSHGVQSMGTPAVASAQPLSTPLQKAALTIKKGQRSARRLPSRSSALQLVAAATLVIGFVVGRIVPTSVHQATMFKDRSSVGIALVSETSKSWGTELTFHLSNLPQTHKIGAWIRTTGGRSRVVICWWPLHQGSRSGTFIASTPVPRSSIVALGIFTGAQQQLWWMPATSI